MSAADGLNLARCRRLVERAIARLELDLSGLIVLTEAATGPFALTAGLAAAAGAERVVAIAAGSRYGSAAEAHASTLGAAAALGVRDRLTVVADRGGPEVATADVVTNLGFVRPLDAAFLQRLKPTSAIPLMYETWELRDEDIDVGACRRLGIPVLGTDEAHPALDTIAYVGQLALKVLLESQIEVLHGRFVVLGGGQFGESVVEALRRAGATPKGVIHWREPDLGLEGLAEADALIVAEHERRAPLVGDAGPLRPAELMGQNPALTVVHIAGGVDRAALVRAGLRCHPDTFAPAGRMSLTTAYLGPRPLVDLHAGGLKVGELLARARLAGLSGAQAEEQALRHPICQGFPG